MLSELLIENYRGIKNLDLGTLGKINIIAGANNTGKTSILEVIRSLEAPDNLRFWKAVGRRESLGNSGVVIGTRISYYDMLNSLFSYEIDGDSESINYKGRHDEKNFDVIITKETMDIYMSGKDLNDAGLYSVAGYGERIDPDTEYEARVMQLSFFISGEMTRVNQIYEVPGVPLNSRSDMNKANKIAAPVIYISPVQHAQNQLYLKSILTDPDLYEQFVEIMRQFDPGFLSINSVDGKYVVLSKNHKEGLMLNAYGDGMKKAMLLLSAVIRAKDGILLLDEFETAIHVSAMKSVFEWIITTAVALNVQIFMTSHSIEAIESVLKCAPELQKEMRMITMVKVENQLKVRNVDGEKAVQLMDEYGLELR